MASYKDMFFHRRRYSLFRGAHKCFVTLGCERVVCHVPDLLFSIIRGSAKKMCMLNWTQFSLKVLFLWACLRSKIKAVPSRALYLFFG
jgi:hypothetical protein